MVHDSLFATISCRGAGLLKRGAPGTLKTGLVKHSSGKLSCDGTSRVYNTSRWYAAEFVDGTKQRRSV